MNYIKTIFIIVFMHIILLPLMSWSDPSAAYSSEESNAATFVKTVEGTGRLTAVLQTADGGYVMSSNIDGMSVLVRKLNDSGQKQWERRLNLDAHASFPYPSSSVNSIAQTSDGGIVLAGTLGCDYGCWDNGSPFLIKLKADGSLEWRKTYTGEGIHSQIFTNITPTSDNGVITTGAVYSADVPTPGIVLLRVADSGEIVWQRGFKSFPDAIYVDQSIAKVDKGFVLSFKTVDNVQNPHSVDIVKISDSGKFVWKKTLSASGFNYHSAGSTADGGIIVVGTSTLFKGLLVIALKADGTLNWKQGYSIPIGGAVFSDSSASHISSPAQTPDGGYALTGTVYDNSTQKVNGFLVKIDSSRKVAFHKTFGDDQVYGKWVFAAQDGGLFLFGSAHRDLDTLIMKANSGGIIPGCDFIHNVRAGANEPFGPLSIGGVNTIISNTTVLHAVDIELNSFITNFPVSNLCH